MTPENYIYEHGLTDNSIDRFQLTFDETHLYIPIQDEEGKPLFTKIRNLEHTEGGKIEKYKNTPGSHAVLFNLHRVKDLPNIVLCEGEMDCIRLQQDGIAAISSTGGAQTFLPEWVELLKDKKIWLCYDNDSAGKKGIRQVLNLLPTAKVITLPEETKDICEYFTLYTRQDFTGLIKTALVKEEWESANVPEEYTLLSPQDYEAMPEDTAPWLIDNIVYSEGFCFIYGAEGTGKSFLTLDMAKAIVQGIPWLNKFKTTKTNILFLDKENPHSITKRRIAGLGVDSKSTPNIYWLKYPEKFQLAGPHGGYSEFATAITSAIENKHIGLVIFDSFVDFMVGNESSSGDTQDFFESIRELYPRVAYIALHHENKPSQGTFRNDSQRLRGSSNINAQTITMFRLETAKEENQITLKQTKTKDAQKLDKFLIKMEVKKNADDTTTVTGFTYLGAVKEEEDADKAGEAQNLIEEMISAQKVVNRNQIMEIAMGKGIAERTVRRTLKKMVDDRTLSEAKKGREKWYSACLFSTKDVIDELDGEID